MVQNGRDTYFEFTCCLVMDAPTGPSPPDRPRQKIHWKDRVTVCPALVLPGAGDVLLGAIPG
jgi:hypothetical protein